MQFAFKKHNSPVAYCALSIKSGTRNEGKKYGGLAHFVEHLLFKGTKYRSASVVNGYIEKLGGELNAYTSKEETVIHATVLKEDLHKAVGLLIEMGFLSTFPEKEFLKEKDVVMDEISSYKDSPSEQIYDDFEELLFKGSPLATPVLGSEESLKQISLDVVNDYYTKFFTSENMSFTLVADVDENEAIKIVTKSLLKYKMKNPTMRIDLDDIQKIINKDSSTFANGNINQGSTSSTANIALEHNATNVDNDNTFHKVVELHNHQTHCILGCKAYSYYDQKRIPLTLLLDYLGGSAANSRLNTILRERNALVYSVEASYAQYLDTGAITIYFGCDKENYQKCIDLIKKELKAVVNKKIPSRTLKAVKKQFMGQFAIASDNGEAQCLSMGKSLMIHRKLQTVDDIRKEIEAVSAEDMQNVARELLIPEKLCILTYKNVG